jgi:hypothetical protein
MSKEFFAFLTQKENPPSGLAEATRKDIILSFKGRSIISKFLLFQFLGGLFSMSFCPQFGLGVVEGHGIAHFFRMIGDWACAAFCGSLFLSAAAAMAFIGMKGEELWWVWRRHKYMLVFLPAMLWSALMLGNLGLNLKGESSAYHLMWIAAAVLTQSLWMQTRSLLYQRNHQKVLHTF